MIPPALFYVRLPKGEEKARGLVIPIFLLWPLAIPLAMLAEMIAFATALAILPFGRRRAKKVALFFPCLNALICALPGLTVEVSQPGRALRLWIR